MSFAMAYVPPVTGIPTCHLVRKTCREHFEKLQEAQLIMEWEFSTFSRALNGLAPLDLNYLVKLPLAWWFAFFLKLTAAKLAQWDTDSLNEEKSA